MASFIMHHVIGKEFLRLLEDTYSYSLKEEEKNAFLLGNLIPDSRDFKAESLNAQEEKFYTHFKSKENLGLCIQTPVLETFIQKYKPLFKEDFSVLGYLFHLYTDKLFYEEFFPKTIIHLDEEGNVALYKKDVRFIKVLKNGKIYTPQEFWSRDGIYHEYTLLNKWVLKEYKTTFEKDALMSYMPYFKNPGIEEVDYQNGYDIIQKTASYVEDSKCLSDAPFTVFSQDAVRSFMDQVGPRFLANYKEVVELTLNRRY